MNICMDINPLVTGHRFRGIGHYVSNLLYELSQLNSPDQLYLYHSYLEPEVTDCLPFPTRLISHEPSAFISQLKQDQIDLFHITDYYHPPYQNEDFNDLVCSNIKTVITINDLIPLIFPNLYEGERYFWLSNVEPLFPSVDRIIAISASTKDDLIKFSGIEGEKIVVIHDGVDLKRFHTSYPQEAIFALKNKYHLNNRFVLFVGGLDWRKNLSGLLEGLALFQSNQREPFDLVLVGQDSTSIDLTDEINRLGLQNTIHLLGYISDEELPLLYCAAAIFASPSYYEGFNLPVLEAMACGVPVMTCHNSSIPEIAGDSVYWVDPSSAHSIAQGLESLARDTILRESLIKKGLNRVKCFTWEQTALKTWETYHSLL